MSSTKNKPTRRKKSRNELNGDHKAIAFLFEITTGLVGVIVLSAMTIVIRRIFPGITGDYLSIIAATTLLVLILVIISFRREIQTTPIKQKGYFITGAGILLFLAAITFFLVSAYKEERTVYFLIDASENMEGFLEQVSPRVSLAIDSAGFPDNVELGMAVYGGNLTGLGGCEDVTRLVEPSPRQQSIQRIINGVNSLSQFKPSGMAGLQAAILDAFSALKDRRGLQQIFVITYGPDSRCGTLSRDFLNKIAEDYNVEYELRIISMGEIDEEDKRLLKAFADVYQDVGLDQLESSVEEVLTIPPQVYNFIYPSR